MSNVIYSYFYAPSWDYPPDGPIKLGNVITSIERPEDPLHTAPYPKDEELILSEKKQVEYSREKLRAGKFSILTKFLSILGVGVDEGLDWARSNQTLYAFTNLSTTQFIPRESYIQHCVSAEPVARFLQKSRYSKPVYIITGVKTVTGAKAKTARTRALDGNISVEVDGTVWSGGTVPIGGNPEIELKRTNKESTTWDESSDFVFAFRVRKVKIKKKTGEAVSTDFRKGAMLDSEQERKENAGVPFYIEAVEEGNAAEVGWDGEELMEDGEVIIGAVPRKKKD